MLKLIRKRYGGSKYQEDQQHPARDCAANSLLGTRHQNKLGLQAGRAQQPPVALGRRRDRVRGRAGTDEGATRYGKVEGAARVVSREKSQRKAGRAQQQFLNGLQGGGAYGRARDEHTEARRQGGLEKERERRGSFEEKRFVG